MTMQQQEGNAQGNTPVIPVEVEKAINMRQNSDGSPISDDQRERITDAYCGTTQALRDNNTVQADMTAARLQAIYEKFNKVPWWKRALQVLGLAGLFTAGYVTHKAIAAPKTDANSTPVE